MIEPGTAALIASCVALLVGVSSITATLWSTHRNRLAALELQYAGERAKALVQVVQLIEACGRAAEDRIFNLTEARRDEDPITGQPGDPYAPRRRPHTERLWSDEADARALVGAYGDHEMDMALFDWVQSLDAIDRQFDDAEFNYVEGRKAATAGEFAIVSLESTIARTRLRALIRETIRVVPPRRRRWLKLPG